MNQAPHILVAAPPTSPPPAEGIALPKAEGPPRFSGFQAARRAEAAGAPAPALSAGVEADRARATIGDRLGIFLSALCILHCALTPIVLLLLPSMNFVFFREDFHAVIAFLIAGAALLAFLPGYRAHRDPRAFKWAAPGFAAIVIAALWAGPWVGAYGEAILSIAGSALLIRAHRLNRALCACCRPR